MRTRVKLVSFHSRLPVLSRWWNSEGASLRTFSDKNCFFNGSETVSDMMTADEYERLAPEEKEHFTMCVKCGEMFDRRSLDEVL